MPLVREAGEVDGDVVLHVDGDLAVCPRDFHVVFLDRKLRVIDLLHDGAFDLLVVVRAGGFCLVDDDLPHLRRFHFHGDHLPGDEDGDGQQDQSDQTSELTLASLAAAQTHTGTSVANQYS